MKPTFVIFALGEIAYVVSVRLLLQHFHGGLLQQELYWSAIRVISICVLVWLYRQSTVRRPRTPARFSPRLLVATGMLLAPILTGDMGPLSPARSLFAATSVLVAVR